MNSTETTGDGVAADSPLLAAQIDLLKVEIDTVTSSIRAMDDIQKSIKQWTLTLWTGAIGFAVSQSQLKGVLWVTAAIPLLFWVMDGFYRRIQRRFIWRMNEIAEFLNDDRLAKSFKSGAFVDFKLLDPTSRFTRAKGGREYRTFVSLWRVMLFQSIALLYLSLVALSVIVHFVH
jgi:hypothetical protein